MKKKKFISNKQMFVISFVIFISTHKGLEYNQPNKHILDSKTFKQLSNFMTFFKKKYQDIHTH